MQKSMRWRLKVSGILLALIVCGAATAEELAGTWTLTIDTPRGVQHPTLVIEKGDQGYSGVYNSLRGPIDIERIEREGERFWFPLTISVPIGDIEVNYAGSFEGDDMTGAVQSPRGTVPFTARRGPE
jgi:hypothetical protein